MVVIITTRARQQARLPVRRPVDEGLVEFARVYLNERLDRLPARHARASSPPSRAPSWRHRARLPGRSAARLRGRRSSRRRGPCTWAVPRGCSSASAARASSISTTSSRMLEERYNLLELLSGALRGDDVYLRIGREIERAVAAGVLAGRRQLRGRQPQPRHGERPRPDAHGLPAHDRRRARRGRQPELLIEEIW